MITRLGWFVFLAIAACDRPDRLCETEGCVSKSSPDCPSRRPPPGEACDFDGECFYCTAESPDNAVRFECVGGELDLTDVGLDGGDCEGTFYETGTP